MTYTIDLTIDIKKNKNIESTKEYLYDLAKGYECSLEYFQYETEGIGHLIKKNTCIYSISFEEKNIEKFINFIKSIKTINNVFIDLIYDDTEKDFNIIFNKNSINNNNKNNKNKNHLLIQKVLK